MHLEKLRILITEDRENSRSSINNAISDLNCHATSPNSFEELKHILAFEFFDGTLFDYDLREWELGKILKRNIKNGGQIAKFYRDIHNSAFVSAYSAYVPLKNGVDDGIFYFTLNKPLPINLLEVKKKLEPFLKTTQNSRLKSHLYLPFNKLEAMSAKERLRHYKKLYRQNKEWLNFNFQFVGDHAWAVVCGPRIEKAYYGKSLFDETNDAANFGIKTHKAYPTKRDIRVLGKRQNQSAFVCWDFRTDEHLLKQFSQAGEKLNKISKDWRDYFSVAVADPCGEAYLSGQKEAIKWSENLTFTGQFEFTKRVFKGLLEIADKYNFQKLINKTELPRVIEIYQGRVIEVNSKEQVAWVRLENIESGKNKLDEPFDLKRLQYMGIKYEGQQFEYTIYEQPVSGDICSNFEPVEISINPFSELLNL